MSAGDYHGRGRRVRARAGVVGLALSLLTGAIVSLGTAGSGFAVAAGSERQPSRADPGQRLALMRMAAREFGVPVRLLLAISYNQTRWERSGGAPSIDSGYGLMDLTAGVPHFDGQGGTATPSPRGTGPAVRGGLLGEAARLLHLPISSVRTNELQNVRGAAAVLAHYARELDRGSLPTSLGGWYGAVASYSAGANVQAARRFADDVYATLRRGASLVTLDGQFLDLPPTRGVRPERAQLRSLTLPRAPATTPPAHVDCPPTLDCSFVAAGYAQDSSDPGDYGNFDHAGRPGQMLNPAGHAATMKIEYIIIHDTEGSYDSAINTFQNPASQVSANYVIRSSDGAVTEMVHPHDVSWDASNWYVNVHAINVENEGFAAQGGTWYTEAMYQSCARLVRYLAAKYHIPLDREHILGHDEVPGPTDYYTALQHWDPGPFWNWNHFMALLRGVSDTAERAHDGSATRGTHHLVTIDPNFASNEPVVTDCPPAGCVTLPSQPSNFVYLRTGPGTSYRLISDAILNPGGTRGTTVDSDWGDRAATGESFVSAGQSGNWTAIWFSGQTAWFYNPHGAGQAAVYSGGEVITPKAGLKSIPVYGAALPEAAAYPSAVPVTKVVKLTYTISAGQEYPTIGTVPTDNYYAATIDSSLPDDHTVIIGKTAYMQISFNHRTFFLRARDVTIKDLS